MNEDYDKLESALKETLARKEKEKQDEEDRKHKNDMDRLNIVGGIGKDLTESLRPVLSEMVSGSKMNTNELRSIFEEVLRDKIAFNIPEIKSPEVKIPPFNIPKPEVTVNVPEMKFPKFPDIPKLPDVMKVLLHETDMKHPIPVMMVDLKGDPWYPTFQGGNAPRVVSLNTSDPLYDTANNALRINAVVGGGGGTQYQSGSARADATGTLALGDDGNTLWSIRTGPGVTDAQTIRVIQATDSVSSVAFGGNLAEDHNIGPSGANTLRVTVATDSNASVNITGGSIGNTGFNITGQDENSGPVSATTLRVVSAVDVGTSVNIIAGSIANTGFNITGQDENIGPSGSQTLRVTVATDSVSSISGSAVSGKNETTNDVLRVIQMTDTVTSANIVTFNGNAPATGQNETTGGVLRVVHMTDTASSSQTQALAMTTNPTAVADAAVSFAKSDKLGRLLSTPVQVRQLRTTAYATLNSNGETTIVASPASTFLDLIYISFANTSANSVNVDLRSETGAGIVNTYALPANATQGFSTSVPFPQNTAAATWTVKFNGSDISTTTIYVNALFSQET